MKWIEALFETLLFMSLACIHHNDENKKFSIIKYEVLHRFQCLLIDRVGLKNIKAVDIGGVGMDYSPDVKKTITVNAMNDACLKAKIKGHEVYREDAHGIHYIHAIQSAELFMMFETLEHLRDPIGFLCNLVKVTSRQPFVITVPYVQRSRVSLRDKNLSPEDLHVFELCPSDWKRIFHYTGWDVVYEEIFYQYPKWHWLWITKYIWKRWDYEGFYGAILRKSKENEKVHQLVS